MIPVLVLCGEAGSGKDSLANHLAQKIGGHALGFADPLKQFVKDVFDFTDEQLWGPSEFRNAIDIRFSTRYAKNQALARLEGNIGQVWCKTLFDHKKDEAHHQLMNVIWPQIYRTAHEVNGLSPRFVLQILGTEWAREIDPNVWVKRSFEVSKKLLCGGHDYSRSAGLSLTPGVLPAPLAIITDGRFPNEILEVKSRGAAVLRIFRHNKADTASTGISGHPSEGMSRIPLHFFDAILHNDGSLEEFLHAGLHLVQDLFDIRLFSS